MLPYDDLWLSDEVAQLIRDDLVTEFRQSGSVGVDLIEFPEDFIGWL